MGAVKGKIARGEFWSRLEAAQRLAEVKAARFDNDTPERQFRRKAEAVVFPERFNGSYLPHYFRSAPAAFHLELYRSLETDRRIVARAPRGHAKSTVITFAYTLHQVACAPVLRGWLDGRLAETDPGLHQAITQVLAEAGRDVPLWWDPYVQIISATAEQAEEFTAAIKLELGENELLRSDWGVLIEGRQSDGDFVSTTNVRVKAFGMEGSIRGGKHNQWRPTLSILDDPDSERTIGTLAVRDRQQRKVTAAVSYGLEPKVSRVFMVGTPMHPDCLVCRFTKPGQFVRWTKLRFAAIDEDGHPLWPDRWSVEALRDEEADDPEAFLMEMMDVPPSSGKPFETIHYYDRREWENAPLPKVLAFDPSLGKTEKSDFQAVVVLRGPTPDNRILVHRVELLRIGDPAALVARVSAIYDEEQPDAAVIETIGFQALLEVMLTTEGDRTGLFPAWQRIESQTQSKDLRIRSLAPLINQGRMPFPGDRTCRPLEAQALDYPDGKRDGLDVTEMALRLIRRNARGQSGILHIPRERSRHFGAGAW